MLGGALDGLGLDAEKQAQAGKSVLRSLGITIPEPPSQCKLPPQNWWQQLDQFKKEAHKAERHTQHVGNIIKNMESALENLEERVRVQKENIEKHKQELAKAQEADAEASKQLKEHMHSKPPVGSSLRTVIQGFGTPFPHFDIGSNAGNEREQEHMEVDDLEARVLDLDGEEGEELRVLIQEHQKQGRQLHDRMQNIQDKRRKTVLHTPNEPPTVLGPGIGGMPEAKESGYGPVGAGKGKSKEQRATQAEPYGTGSSSSTAGMPPLPTPLLALADQPQGQEELQEAKSKANALLTTLLAAQPGGGVADGSHLGNALGCGGPGTSPSAT